MAKSKNHKIINIACVVAISALLANAGLVVGESWEALAIIVLSVIASR